MDATIDLSKSVGAALPLRFGGMAPAQWFACTPVVRPRCYQSSTLECAQGRDGRVGDEEGDGRHSVTVTLNIINLTLEVGTTQGTQT